MRRITADEVKAAYKKIGRWPTTRDWDNGVQCCGLAAVCIADGQAPEHQHEWLAKAQTVFGRGYATGFIEGFDGHKPLTGPEDYECGFADGRAAREAVIVN